MKQEACDLFAQVDRREQRESDSQTPGGTFGRTIGRGKCSTRCPAVDISVDRSREASCLPGVRRLNEMRRNASGVFVPLARRGQSAERAGAPALFGALGSPGGDPGAGVAP